VTAPAPAAEVRTAAPPKPVPPGAEPPPAGPPWSPRRRVLALYGSSRLLTIVVAAVAGIRLAIGPTALLRGWDSGWFLEVARHGYPDRVPLVAGHAVQSTLAFFPALPLLLRVVHAVTALPGALAGSAVSMAAGAVAAVLLYRIAERVTGDVERSVAAVVLFSVFPGSMVLSMPYSEGVMVAAAAGCLLALLDERWVVAGLCAALATATRASAIALVPACAWQAAVALRRSAPSGPATAAQRWRPLAAPLLAPLGALAWFAYLAIHTGDRLAYFHAESAWDTGVRFGRPALVLAGRFLRAPFTDPVPAIATLTLVFAAATGILLWRRRWPAVLSVYTFSVLLISVLTRADGLRPRDVLTALPLFIAAADVLGQRALRYAVPTLSVLLALSLTFHNIGAWGQP